VGDEMDTAIPAGSRPEHFSDVDAGAGLLGWLRIFVRQISPQIIAVSLLAAVVARIAAGSFTRIDVVIAAGLIAAQPFVEWLTHVFMLHFKPRTLRGRRIDPYMARKHRRHHLDPAHIGLVFIATPAVLVVIPAYALVAAVAFRSAPLALSAMVAALSLMLIYEWTHFIIHTPWVPRTRAYRYIWRAHRLHHFKNEHYWFGITTHLADHVLRTFPDRGTVETSPTARVLAGS